MTAPRSSHLSVLVVGGGGREHALAWALKRSPSVARVASAPGNAGTAEVGRNFAVAAEDVEGIVALARAELFDLVVVGPETPLTLGVADAIAAAGIPVFGCSGEAAAIEGSKAFSKSLMVSAGVPTARHGSFSNDLLALEFARELLVSDGRVVVKADGLAAGKGVSICGDEGTARDAIERFCADGGSVVIEEFLVGREASCMALVDGERVFVLPACEDHKTVHDGDRGPMTGGMGAISPTSVVDAALLGRVEREILIPTARALAEGGRPFRGLLYAGIMATEAGPKVLEFNCRFGDPEAQALLYRYRGDLAQALLSIATGGTPSVDFWPVVSCTVVMCARGYPGSVEKGAEVSGVADARATGAEVFLAGIRRDGDRLFVDGGRVLAVTASGADLEAARARAYAAVALIHFQGEHHRSDIGGRRPR